MGGSSPVGRSGGVTGASGVGAPGGAKSSFGGLGIPGLGGKSSIASIQKAFNIGQPIDVGNGSTVPWSMATPSEQLGSILKSPGAQSAASAGALMLGGSLAISGLAHPFSIARNAETVIGGALAGYGAATMIGGSLAGPFGLVAGAGLGLAAAGIARGGIAGLGMDIAGGAVTGAAIGSLVLPGAGTLIGGLIGAAAGAVAGGIRLLFPGQLQRIRAKIKSNYGIDIPNQKILQQIADIVNQKYGGDINVGVFSTDVQDLVRLYALTTGQGIGGLPRPMYSATFAQSQVGGLQLQPVYSGGQLVQNPYTGITTSQLANTLATSPPVYVQLNPSQANSLFEGRVTQVIANNPGAVASATATAASSGQSRLAMSTALLEPGTLVR
jgi:hypothetical protein